MVYGRMTYDYLEIVLRFGLYIMLSCELILLIMISMYFVCSLLMLVLL